MSFGFSIGDIVLLGQLSYRLYAAVRTGRRGASQNLKGLEDRLFGLRCALDHLAKVASEVSSLASGHHDEDSAEMRQKLDGMMNSCGETLQTLDAVAQKYRDGMESRDEGGEPPLENSKVGKRSLFHIRRTIEVNWAKVRWDFERHSLREYNEKLQAHTEAINLVLNTFLW
jgi:hypothetical protein